MRLTLPLLLLITACGDKDADSGAPTGDCPAMGVRGQVTDEAGSPGPYDKNICDDGRHRLRQLACRARVGRLWR